MSGYQVSHINEQELKELGALKENLKDPVWRITHLYKIKDAEGNEVRFVPKPEQMEIIVAIHVRKLRKILIPKARQLGMSTVIAIILLDLQLFTAGFQGAVIDQTQEHATKKLRGKIVFAMDLLPKLIRRRFRKVKSNDHVLEIRLRKANGDEDSASQIQAGMRARGDTFQALWVSEWGPIAFEDPKRSEEIMTGARPAAKKGIEIIETTWKGGKCGHLWNLTKRAMTIADEYRTEDDFTVFFFPWWVDPDYELDGDARQIDAECRKYFEETEAEISAEQGKPFRFTARKKLWYFKNAWIMGLLRYQEFPSFLAECFRAPIEGAIYGKYVDKLRARGGTASVEVDPEALVNTSWDRGAPLNVVTWYWQIIGDEIRFIDCDLDLDITVSERVTRMKEKGYRFGYHFLPHDVTATDGKGRTFLGELRAAGLENCRVVPRTDDVWVGINYVREKLFSRFTMRMPQCEEGLNRLEAYRVSVLIDGGRQTEIPVHDQASHAADALRMLGEADMAGMVSEGWVKSIFSKAGLEALKTGGSV